MDKNTLAHTTWECKYHIVFAPKYRRRAIYGTIKADIGEILRELCERKEIEIIEAELCPDHSQYAVDAFNTEASDYLLKSAAVERIETVLSRLRNPVLTSSSRIRVQTFGNFEIFADDKPILFSRAKSKELLAYLIDRQGAGVTKKQLSSVLWEDDVYNRSRLSYLQTLVSEMMKALKAVNAADIIIKGHNSLAVDKTKFDCDYYRYLNGEVGAFNLYIGEYMANYSWAEATTAALNMPK